MKKKEEEKKEAPVSSGLSLLGEYTDSENEED